jgi:hypothetical protein
MPSMHVVTPVVTPTPKRTVRSKRMSLDITHHEPVMKPLVQIGSKEAHDIHKQRYDAQKRRQQDRMTAFRKRETERTERRRVIAEKERREMQVAEKVWEQKQAQKEPTPRRGLKVHPLQLQGETRQAVLKLQGARPIRHQRGIIDMMGLGKQRGLLGGVQASRLSHKARQHMHQQKLRDMKHVSDKTVGNLTELFQRTKTTLAEEKQEELKEQARVISYPRPIVTSVQTITQNVQNIVLPRPQRVTTQHPVLFSTPTRQETLVRPVRLPPRQRVVTMNPIPRPIIRPEEVVTVTHTRVPPARRDIVQPHRVDPVIMPLPTKEDVTIQHPVIFPTPIRQETIVRPHRKRPVVIPVRRLRLDVVRPEKIDPITHIIIPPVQTVIPEIIVHPPPVRITPPSSVSDVPSSRVVSHTSFPTGRRSTTPSIPRTGTSSPSSKAPSRRSQLTKDWGPWPHPSDSTPPLRSEPSDVSSGKKKTESLSLPSLPSLPSVPPLRLRGGVSGNMPRGTATRSSGGIQGMDVQRRPNFSIIQQGANIFIFAANDVNAGVGKQIASFLKRVRGKLSVNGARVSKRAAKRVIMQQLRKGSVEIIIQ